MKKIGLFIVLLFSTLLSTRCQDKKATTAVPIDNSSWSDTIQLPRLMGLKPSLQLTPDASITTADWVLYTALVESLDSLDTGTIGDLKRRLATIYSLFDDAQKAQEAGVDPIPSDLQTNAIKARVNALKTQIKALKNEAVKNDPDAQKITASIARSKNALQDLNLQINERFSLSIEEMLEAANEIPDSTKINDRLKSSFPNQ